MVINELTTIDGFASELLTEEFLEEGAFDMIKKGNETGQEMLADRHGTSSKK